MNAAAGRGRARQLLEAQLVAVVLEDGGALDTIGPVYVSGPCALLLALIRVNPGWASRSLETLAASELNVLWAVGEHTGEFCDAAMELVALATHGSIEERAA